jgi:dTDP-D-glucose 4,6-dehydratase
VNQFVLDAYTKRDLLIYQRGYSRSFVHVRDVVSGFILGLDAAETKVRGQIFNLGTEEGNYRKDEIVQFVLKRLPETTVRYKDLTFGGDMRDISVSFAKIRRELGFKTEFDVDDGVREVLHALQQGLIKNPHDDRFRNAQFIVLARQTRDGDRWWRVLGILYCRQTTGARGKPDLRAAPPRL